MSIRFLGNGGKVFPRSIFPETKNSDPVKDLHEKKKRLQALRSKAAAKFKPIPPKILSLINKLDSMLQSAEFSSSVTESKVMQLLSQISSMIENTKGSKKNSKNDDLFITQRVSSDEALSKSESVFIQLKKRQPGSLLHSDPALESRLVDQV